MTVYISRDGSEALEHYGVKGMKWGVRKNKEPSSRKINRMAKKDAKEYARAKMYYGEGAGNRRKLIKNTVEQRSKNSSRYKSAFETHLANQQMDKHAAKAKKERRIADVKKSAGRGFRGAINIAAGNPQRAAASVLAVYGVMRVTGADKQVVSVGEKYAHKAMRKVYSMKKAKEIFGNPFKGL